MSNNFKKINEATSAGNAGGYRNPLVMGLKLWGKKTLEPYNKKVSKYDNPQLAHDSYDGKLNVSKKKAAQMEKLSKKIANYLKKHPTLNDTDGDNINGGNGPKQKTKPLNEDLAVWFGTKKKTKRK